MSAIAKNNVFYGAVEPLPINDGSTSATETWSGQYLNQERTAINSKISQLQSGSKNLLDTSKLTTQTISGVTFTPHYTDGKLDYVNVNGTSTAGINYSFGNQTLKAGNYLVNTNSPSMIGGVMALSVGSANAYNTDVALNLASDTTVESHIYAWSGKTFNNVKVYPMVRKSTESADYVPFVPSISDINSKLDKKTTTFTPSSFVTVNRKTIDIRNGILRYNMRITVASGANSNTIGTFGEQCKDTEALAYVSASIFSNVPHNVLSRVNSSDLQLFVDTNYPIAGEYWVCGEFSV